jgi:hypothetical protein
MDEIQVNTENTNLEVDLEVDDEYNKRKEEEEIEDKKIKSVIDNYENFPHKCQAEIFNDENGTICNGSIIEREFVFRYRPNIRHSCNHRQNINFCEYHYNCIISSNKGVKPEPYYEWRISEAIYELIKGICLEYK